MFLALYDPISYVVKCLFFLWESIGQYQPGIGLGDVVWDVREVGGKGRGFWDHVGG